MSEQCSTCRFFGKSSAGSRHHVCRRHPPHPMMVGGVSRSDFPVVLEDDWCGEWKGERVTSVRHGEPFPLPTAGEGRVARITATAHETYSQLLVEVQDDDGSWVPATTWTPRPLVPEVRQCSTCCHFKPQIAPDQGICRYGSPNRDARGVEWWPVMKPTEVCSHWEAIF